MATKNNKVLCVVRDRLGAPVHEPTDGSRKPAAYNYQTDPGTDEEIVMAGGCAGDAGFDDIYDQMNWRELENQRVEGFGEVQVTAYRENGEPIAKYSVQVTVRVTPVTGAKLDPLKLG